MAVTAEQIAIVKSTAPVLKEHGNAITEVFYRNLLTAHPSLNSFFNQTDQATLRQPRALANAVLAYATYIDDLPKLAAAVERIAHKHASLAVQPAHYPVVGTFLLQAIGEVLGAAATPAIVDAWGAAYGQLADVFVGREAALYKAQVGAGWPQTGWKKFTVARRIDECDVVTSFYLSPSDGALPLPAYRAGQYVSLQVEVPELGYKQPRQYSLSEAPGVAADYYRISVKREAPGKEPGKPGVVSNILHDTYFEGSEVELSHPQGDFFLDAAGPVVLISAGVGATSLLSMLNALTAETTDQQVRWIHASHSKASQPFADHVRGVTLRNDNVRAHVFLSEVGEGDVKGKDYDFVEHLDLGKLDKGEDLFVGEEKAAYYVCGPEKFMSDVIQGLVGLGVAEGQIKTELYHVSG